MSHYSFRIKYKDLEFELKSQDKDFLNKNSSTWAATILKIPSMSSSINKAESKPVTTEILLEKTGITKNKNVDTILEDIQVTAKDLQPEEDKADVINMLYNDDLEESVPILTTEDVEEPIDTESTPLLTEQSLLEEEGVAIIESINTSTNGDAELDLDIDIDKLMDEIISEDNEEQITSRTTSSRETVVQNISKTTATSSIPTLPEFLYGKNITNSKDYLLYTAYYLEEYAHIDKYSLKQLNSFILKVSKEPINHSVIQLAVNESLIAVQPDYTGEATATEYSLTDHGKLFIESQVKV